MSDLPNAINLARRLSRQNEPDLLRELLAAPALAALHLLRYFWKSPARALIFGSLGDTST